MCPGVKEYTGTNSTYFTGTPHASVSTGTFFCHEEVPVLTGGKKEVPVLRTGEFGPK